MMKNKLIRLKNRITEIDKCLTTVEAESKAMKVLIEAWERGDRITYKNMGELAYYEPLNIGEGVMSFRIPSQDGTISFIVIMEDQGELVNHFHDCKELLIRLYGDLLVNGEKMKTKEIVFEIDEDHHLQAVNKTLLIVHFEKP